MCNNCQTLIDCPLGEKRKLVLSANHGKTFDAKMEIVLNRYSEFVNVILHTEFQVNGFWHNLSVPIYHCPCCGEEFK